MRRRVYRLILAATALAIVAFALPLAVAVRQLNNDEAIARLEREAARAALNVRSPSSLDALGDRFPRSSGEHTFAVYDTQGRRRLGDGPAHADQLVESALSGSMTSGVSSHELEVALPLTFDDQVFAVVRAATPRSDVRGDVVRSWGVMLGIGVVILAAAAAFGRWEARRLSRPVEDLAVALTELGKGDFTTSAPRSGIPEIDEAAEALDVTADRLGRLLARERAFSADASHQLRTPLTGLRLQLENAQLLPPEQRAGALAEALAAVDRLERTVNDMLALARDTGPPRETIDLAALVQGETAGWRLLGQRTGRTLAVRIPEGLPPVKVSPAAVRQILGVLVSNAFVHGAGTVGVEVLETPGGVAIDVTDEGPGVTGDPRAVFERRAPADPRRTVGRPGATDRADHNTHGIGLALARSLSETEGGRLLLRAPGPHPRFSLILPISDDADGDAGTLA